MTSPRKHRTAQQQDMLNRRLAVAVCGFKLDEVKQLLRDGADPNYRQSGDEPLLSFAAQFDTPDVVELLIHHGADVNACDKAGVTPLHCALDMAELDNARVLIKHGADINHQMVVGQTPPPWVAALDGDRLAPASVRTRFVLSHAPDFSLTFDHHDTKGMTAHMLLGLFRGSATPKNRDAIEECAHMVDGYIEERARQAEQLRIDAARRQWLDGVQRKPGRKFKL